VTSASSRAAACTNGTRTAAIAARVATSSPASLAAGGGAATRRAATRLRTRVIGRVAATRAVISADLASIDRRVGARNAFLKRSRRGDIWVHPAQGLRSHCTPAHFLAADHMEATIAVQGRIGNSGNTLLTRSDDLSVRRG
jgi:hypothetical protein